MFSDAAMTPERCRQIEELYHAARERAGSLREELLAQADPELRREVESLLVERKAGEFLDRPAWANGPQPEDLTATAIAAFASFGPYRVESKLGEGTIFRFTINGKNLPIVSGLGQSEQGGTQEITAAA